MFEAASPNPKLSNKGTFNFFNYPILPQWPVNDPKQIFFTTKNLFF